MLFKKSIINTKFQLKNKLKQKNNNKVKDMFQYIEKFSYSQRELFDYYNQMSVEDFIKSKQDQLYHISGFGFHNSNGGYNHIGTLYILHAKDFFFDFKTNTIVFNIGQYADKNLNYLLNFLFLPFRNKYGYNLLFKIKKDQICLILKNDIYNQKDEFFNTVNNFFTDYNNDIEIKKDGIWK